MRFAIGPFGVETSFNNYHREKYLEQMNIELEIETKYLDPQYGEASRVSALTGGERWLAQIEGYGADDLAGRSFTITEIHKTVTNWLVMSDPADAEKILPGFTNALSIPFEIEELQRIYKSLWKFYVENPDSADWEEFPSWPKPAITWHHWGGSQVDIASIMQDMIAANSRRLGLPKQSRKQPSRMKRPHTPNPPKSPFPTPSITTLKRK